MFKEMQPNLEIRKRELERQGKSQKTATYFVILLIVGVLFVSCLLIFMKWYTPAKFRAFERALIKREGPGRPDIASGSKTYEGHGLHFSFPGNYALEYETQKSAVFAGTQEDGQLFPAVLSVNFTPTIDYDQLRPCSDVLFRQGITNQCRDTEAVEKIVNDYPYREFLYTGGKGGEEKLKLRVIQFQNPPVEVTHLLYDGLENKLDDILPTFHFDSN